MLSLAHRPLNSNINSGVPRFQILQPAAVSKFTVQQEVLRLSAALENICTHRLQWSSGRVFRKLSSQSLLAYPLLVAGIASAFIYSDGSESVLNIYIFTMTGLPHGSLGSSL